MKAAFHFHHKTNYPARRTFLWLLALYMLVLPLLQQGIFLREAAAAPATTTTPDTTGTTATDTTDTQEDSASDGINHSNAYKSLNNIPFTGYAIINNAACTTAGTTVSGSDNVAKIFNFLVGKGLSDAQAAGILGNIQQESGFSATRQENGRAWPTYGYGIVQWSFGRRSAIEQVINVDPVAAPYYTAQYGGATTEANGYVAEGLPIAVSDRILSIELDFLYQEATTRTIASQALGHTSATAGMTEWDAIKQATTLQEASDIWLLSFEQPANAVSESSNRAQYGQAILDKLKGSSTTTGTATGNTGVCSAAGAAASGDVNSLTSYVLKYAWPDFKGQGYTDKKPEYETAVQQAQAAGRYTGNSCFGGGVDCGGFITTLIVDSGWDPTYNNGGVIANGAGNTTAQAAWLDTHWQRLGYVGINFPTEQLQPGDVAIIGGYHVFMYIGAVDGFSSNVVSASQCSRAPMAGPDPIGGSGLGGQYVWYRKKGASTP